MHPVGLVTRSHTKKNLEGICDQLLYSWYMTGYSIVCDTEMKLPLVEVGREQN